MRVLFIDTETTKSPKMNPWQHGSYLCSIGCALDNNPVETFILTHQYESVEHTQQDILKCVQEYIDAADIIVAHNIKFDINWLKSAGLNFEGKRFWCTMIADYLINGQYKMGYSLDAVAARYKLGTKENKMAEYWANDYETDQIPLDIHIPYLAQDVSLVRDLYTRQLPIIEQNGLGPIAALSFEVSNILSDMELHGFKFDVAKAESIYTESINRMHEIEKEIYKVVGEEFNIGSTQQLSAYLYGGTFKTDGVEHYTVTLKDGTVKQRSRKIRVDRSVPGVGFTPLENSESEVTPGQYSTSKTDIELLVAETEQQELLKKLLIEYSKVEKVASTILAKKKDGGLLRKIGKDGRIHPTFNQCVTQTGRLSSTDPNGQNFPRKGTSPIKECIVSELGCILSPDHAQIEWRVGAEFSRDETMIYEISHGVDAHSENAISFLDAGKHEKDSDAFSKLRTAAKTITFRLLYGGSAHGFFKDGRMPRYPLSKWKKIVSGFNGKYKGLIRWQNKNKDLVYKQGYLRNPSGRILRFRLQKERGIMQYSDKQICNYPVQSGALDIIYLYMAVLYKRMKELGLKSKLILQVHDSLVIDTCLNEVETMYNLSAQVIKELPQLCKQYWGWDFVVPLDGDCEIGPSYGKTSKIVIKENATHCEVKVSTKEGSIDVVFPEKTYLDLLNNQDYITFASNNKIAKLVFKE